MDFETDISKSKFDLNISNKICDEFKGKNKKINFKTQNLFYN